VELDVDAGVEEEPKPYLRETGERSFRIAILGNFSGQAEDKIGLKPIPVDVDTLDDAIARFRPSLVLPIGPAGSPSARVRFNELQDFHPDALYERLPIFQALRRKRSDLSDPEVFAMLSRASAPPAPPPPPPAPPPAGGSLLDAILSDEPEPQIPLPPPPPPTATPGPARRERIGDPEWESVINAIVKPHLVPRQDPRQAEAMQAVSDAIAEQMCQILHDEKVQELESAWRSVDFLLRRIETEGGLSIHLIDISKEELLADLALPDTSSRLRKVLVEQTVETPGAPRWSLLVGLYTFEPKPEELQALARLGTMAQATGAPFLAGVSPRIIGAKSFAEQPDADDWKGRLDDESEKAWNDLRRQPSSRWIGLALPRFILRLPYGEETSSLDLFEFEEMPTPPVHERYLWGNPAVVCACLLAAAFTGESWGASGNEIATLPLHTYRSADGDVESTPCAEVWLSERVAEKWVDAGLIPVASMKNRDSVRVLRFQSVNQANPRLPM
jgi:type VI secretion system protein ImpC